MITIRIGWSCVRVVKVMHASLGHIVNSGKKKGGKVDNTNVGSYLGLGSGNFSYNYY